ncbi:hypothetical protein [Brevundimonas sp. TWP2-3-4b1]|uniref:hypothetical protein n=1 Tax=Brevundimonas sp. TWP2-3-4b1 TaxID=2804580 RepID=UPI003CF0C355
MTDGNESTLRIDRAMINRRIERLAISADLKSLLTSLLDTTIEIGGKLIDLGARVVAFVLEFAKAYPGIAFGIAIALVLSFLIGAIPVIGPLLSPFLTPLLLIIGVGLGALDDLTDGGMRERLKGLQSQLNRAGLA